MYIWLFSQSEGAGRATRRKTRGLTLSVMALMVPPLPAASRPSKMMITRRPLCLTHSCSLQSSPWSLRNSFRYFLFFNFFPSSDFSCLLIRSSCCSTGAARRRSARLRFLPRRDGRRHRIIFRHVGSAFADILLVEHRHLWRQRFHHLHHVSDLAKNELRAPFG